MVDWIVGIVEKLGYFGVAGLMFLENVFPPIPSEAIMPLAGFAAKRGSFDFFLVVLAGTAGSVLGQLPLYYLGYHFKRERLGKLADRYGKWVTVSSRTIDRAAGWFDKYGPAAVIFCRMVPGVRSFISIPAGMARMNLGLFLFYSTIGMGAWAFLLAGAGWLLSSQWERVSNYVGPISYVVIGGLIVGAIVWILYRKKHGKGQPRPARE